jgi:hypothetical protein
MLDLHHDRRVGHGTGEQVRFDDLLDDGRELGRHAGQDDHGRTTVLVAPAVDVDRHPRRPPVLTAEQPTPGRHAGHPVQVPREGVVHLEALGAGPRERAVDPRGDRRLDLELAPEARRHRLVGEVVRGRADPAGGEHQPRPGPGELGLQRLVDRGRLVGDDVDARQRDPVVTQPGREPGGVLVDHVATEDLVTDDDDRGFEHGVLLRATWWVTRSRSVAPGRMDRWRAPRRPAGSLLASQPCTSAPKTPAAT